MKNFNEIKKTGNLRVNLLGQGPRRKKCLPGCGLTKVEKHWSTGPVVMGRIGNLLLKPVDITQQTCKPFESDL